MSDSTPASAAPSSGAGVGPASVVLPSYDNTLGAILLGGFISIFLYGITCLQVFIYHQRYPRDRRMVKYFVYLIWAIDSFDAALTVQICYYYLVSNYANPITIFSPVWSLKLHVLVTSVSDFVVRALFTRRIYTLSHGNKWITGSIMGLSIIDLVVGTVITARAFRIPTFAGLTAVANLFYLNFASNITADMAVMFMLSYYLWTNRTGSRKTDSLVERLILYTINTGAITVIDATLGLICYAAMPTNLVFIAFYLNLSKFFVNSYLASLNVRKTLLSSMKAGAGQGDDAFVSIHLSSPDSQDVSHNMPAFRPMAATGMSLSVPGLLTVHEDPKEYKRGRDCDTLDMDLESGTGTGSTHSRGDVSTAVNTPVDGDCSLLSKGNIHVDGLNGEKNVTSVLVREDQHPDIDPEVRFETSTAKDEDSDSGSRSD